MSDPFHRLNANPSGYDAFPSGYDFINNPAANGDAGVPANAGGKKVGGPNDGTYYVGFGEDATSSDANRGFQALAQNTDFLDNAIRKPLAMPTRTMDATAVGPVTSITLPDASGVFLGSGTDAIPETLLTLFSITDDNDDEVIDPTTGVRCDVTAISGGTVGTGFSAGVVGLTVTPAIPNGTTYRVYYANKSNLLNMPTDALTVIKIRGAQELPAGFEDFQKQISRIIATNVVALVTTMIETPDGVRLSKSKSMSYEVDPDGTVGTIHRFFWRNSRDTGSPVTMFEVNDDTSLGGVSAGRVRLASGYVLEAVGGGLLRDSNIAAGAAQGGPFVPWTSSTSANGDKYLRVFENGAYAFSKTVSLFQEINGRWTTTVGDGTHTFGDFNGADGIQQAITYWKTNIVPLDLDGINLTLLIQVKMGDYTISDGTGAITLPDGVETILEGFGVSAVTLELSTTAAAITGGATSILRMSGMRLFRNSGSAIGISMNASAFQADDCVFMGTQIFLRNAVVIACQDYLPPVLDGAVIDKATYFRRCRFQAGGVALNVLGAPLLVWQFDDNDTARHYGHVFEDCTFYVAESNIPAMRIQALNGTSVDSIAGGFRFVRSNYYLGSSTTSSGNPVGPSGPIDIKSNGTTYGSHGLRITDITFENCNVYAGAAKNTDATVQLLYLTPYDGSGTVRVDSFSIDGGRWLIMKNNPSLLPFWVGSAYDFLDGVANHNPLKFSMKNVTTGWVNAGNYSGDGTTSSTTYGVAPTAYNTVSGLAASDQPAYYLDIQNACELKNITFVGAAGSSVGADLWVNGPISLDVDNIQLTIANAASGLKPNFRMKFIPSLTQPSGWTPVRKVRNVFLNGNAIASLSTLASVDSAALIAIPNGHLEVEDCNVSNFTSGVSTVAGMTLPMLDGALGYLIDPLVAGLKVRRCKFNGNFNAGFQILHSGSASVTVTQVADLEVSDCIASGNSNNGIAIYGNDATTTCSFPNALIDGNACYDNKAANPQLLFLPSAFLQKGAPSISNNRCGSSTGTNPVGIAYGTYKASLVANEFIAGVIYGNSCWSGTETAFGGLGVFNIRRASGSTSNPVDEFSSNELVRLRGIETIRVVHSTVTSREFVNLTPMTGNDAYLQWMP